MERDRSSLRSTLARSLTIGSIVVGAVSLGDGALFHMEESSLRSEHTVTSQTRANAYGNGSDYLNVQGDALLGFSLVSGGAYLLVARRKETT